MSPGNFVDEASISSAGISPVSTPSADEQSGLGKHVIKDKQHKALKF